MVEETASSRMDFKSSLTTKVGPLPVWSYGVILGGFVAGIYLLKRKKGNSSLPISTVTSSNPASNGSYGSGGGGSSAGSGSGSSPTPTTDTFYDPAMDPNSSINQLPYGPGSPGYPSDPTPVTDTIGPTNGGDPWVFPKPTNPTIDPTNPTQPITWPYSGPGYIPPEAIITPYRPDSYIPGSGGAMGSRTYAVNN